VSEHRFHVPAKPRPKGRPRFARGRAYTPTETVAFENAVAAAWRNSDGPLFTGPVEVEIQLAADGVDIVVRELDPASKSTLRGDVDNYVKSCLDGLNGMAFPDDNQVLIVKASKAAVAAPKKPRPKV
jgi:Holliday junction resolvase RusA-like endonuclease